jgi:hypothetical protein
MYLRSGLENEIGIKPAIREYRLKGEWRNIHIEKEEGNYKTWKSNRE